MSDLIRWGILGTARINRALIPAIRASTRNRLVAIASRTPARAKNYAKKWGIDQYYGSYQTLLDNPEIDAVYISLPNHLHAEWAIKAAQSHKHVLCEKPLALSPDEINAIIIAARKNNVFISEGFMYRHHPQTKIIQSLVKSGKLGNIQHIDGCFSIILEHPDDYRWKPEFGGGSIWDLGCYPVSFMRMLVGKNPDEVFGQSVLAPTNVDLTFVGQMKFDNQITAQFYCSFGLPFRTKIEIMGSKGSLFVARPFKPEDFAPVKFVDANGNEELIRCDYPDLYLGEVEDLSNAILFNQKQLIPLEESLQINQILYGLIQSSKIKSQVKLH